MRLVVLRREHHDSNFVTDPDKVNNIIGHMTEVFFEDTKTLPRCECHSMPLSTQLISTQQRIKYSSGVRNNNGFEATSTYRLNVQKVQRKSIFNSRKNLTPFA